MTRKTISITGLGEFQYTEKLLELAMQRTKADLYQDAADRKLYGRSTMSKEQLAIAVVDLHLRELDERRKLPEVNAMMTETLDGYRQELDDEEAETAIAAVDAKRATGDIPALLCAHGIDAGRRCSICAEDTTMVLRLLDTRTGVVRHVLGTSPSENAPHRTTVWVQREGEQGATGWSADQLMSIWHDLVAIDENGNQNTEDTGAAPGSSIGLKGLARFATSYPAAFGWVVTEGHVKYCAEFGHTTLKTDGVLSAMCPRCGENVHEVPVGVPEVTCARQWRDGDIYRTCDVVVSSHEQPTHEGPCFDAFRRVWDAVETARYPAAAEQVESVRCGRSWQSSTGARLTCDVLATRDQVDRSGGGYSKPASGPAHEGPCFDAFRKQWDADAAARYHAPAPIRLGDVVVHKIGSAAEFTVSRVHHMHGLMLTDSFGVMGMTWVRPEHVRVVRRGDFFFFGGRALGQARMGFVRAEETRTAQQQLVKNMTQERSDAPKIDWIAVNRAARGFIRGLLGPGYIPEYYQDFADELTALIKNAIVQDHR